MAKVSTQPTLLGHVLVEVIAVLVRLDRSPHIPPANADGPRQRSPVSLVIDHVPCNLDINENCWRCLSGCWGTFQRCWSLDLSPGII